MSIRAHVGLASDSASPPVHAGIARLELKRRRPWFRGLQNAGSAAPAWTWAVLLYLCAAVGLFGAGAMHAPASTCACLDDGDPMIFMWSLAWWPHALVHGLDPFQSHAIWAPGGANVAAATTIPAAAVAMAPVTALLGPLVAYNILAIIGPALSAFTAFLLCRRLVGRIGPALVGGWLFGFSSYESTQLLGHLNLTLIFMVPVAALLVVKRLDGELSRRRFVGSMTATLVIQALLSTEVLFDLVCVGGLALVLAYLVAERALRDRVRLVLFDTMVATVIAVTILLPYLVAALAVHEPDRGGDAYGLNLLNLVIPSRLTTIGGAAAGRLSHSFENGNIAETGGYIGLPILAINVAYLTTTWRENRVSRWLATLLILCVILALGSPLHIGGLRLFTLPWAVLQRLPIFGVTIPSRLMLFVALGSGVTVTLWLSRDHAGSRRRWLTAIVGLIVLLPMPAARWWNHRPENPAFFRDGSYRHYLAPGENVLTLPFDQGAASLLWQAENHFRFRLAGGYISDVPPAGVSLTPGVDWLLTAHPTSAHVPSSVARALAMLIRHDHIRSIVVEQSYARSYERTLRQIAAHPLRFGGILLYQPSSR